MARTAEETADILSTLYCLDFGQNSVAPYHITWQQLRSLAAVPRLNESFLKAVNVKLSESGDTLIPLNNSLLIMQETELDHYRTVPDNPTDIRNPIR